jgi:hypothetical protein
MVDIRCLTVFSISAHTSQRTQSVKIMMANQDERPWSLRGLHVNSILILFDFNQQKLNVPSMNYTKIHPVEVGSDKCGLADRNDEACITFRMKMHVRTIYCCFLRLLWNILLHWAVSCSNTAVGFVINCSKCYEVHTVCVVCSWITSNIDTLKEGDSILQGSGETKCCDILYNGHKAIM